MFIASTPDSYSNLDHISIQRRVIVTVDCLNKCNKKVANRSINVLFNVHLYI